MSFKQNMLRGLGKCHIEIMNSNDKDKFKKDVLYGALNSISYDTFFEGTKSWYVYDLILNFQDKDFFENKIIEKIESKKNICIRRFNHLTNLLSQFAYDGSKKSKNALERQYCLLFSKKRFASSDYEKLCNLLFIFADLYGNKRVDKIMDDIYAYKLKHPSFDVTNVWYIQSMIYNIDKHFINKLKLYFPEFDFDSNNNMIPLKMKDNINMEDIRQSEISDLPLLVMNINKIYQNELLKYLLEIKDKERSIVILKRLNVSNQLFNDNIELLFALIDKFDNQHKGIVLDFFARHKSKKLRTIAYPLIEDPLFKEQGIELLIANHKKEDDDFLYQYFQSVKFQFRDYKSHLYVSHIIKYFHCKGTDERIKHLLIDYYEHNYCSYCRKEIVELLAKFGMLSYEIINEMQYDCNEDIRKMAKKRLNNSR